MKHTLINIGRQFGSGGKSIASAISQRLGIPVYDQELIVRAAEQSGFSRQLFERSYERRDFLFGLSIPRFGFAKDFVGDDNIFEIQSQIIRDIAEKESAIFVGRASDYVLRDMDCLDVFICAPLENRIRRVCERTGQTPEQAAALIARKDRTRKRYYDYFTLGNWGEASGYDLCVDSSLLGVEGSAELIIDFGRKAGLIG